MAKAEPTYSEVKEQLARASHAIRPEVRAAFVISEFGEHSDVAPLAVQLEIGMNDMRKNDLRECEEMLYCQAHALQAIFVELARQAAFQVKGEGWDPNYEAHMRLALKAQSQCRATLETLATDQEPARGVRATGQHRARPAAGEQRDDASGRASRGAGKNENTPNELLEEKPHERLDFGTPGAAVGADPAPGDRGRKRPGRRRRKVRPRPAGTLTRAARGRGCGNWRDCCGSKPRH